MPAITSSSNSQTLEAQAVCQGLVVQVHTDGRVSCSCELHSEHIVLCELVVTNEGARLRLAPDDRVLLSHYAGKRDGVILGRIGASCAPTETDSTLGDASSEADVPDTLVLEAKHSLTLKVGDGSIEIRDGKVLIKGKDLVSHAQRVNRIKGGSVSIN